MSAHPYADLLNVADADAATKDPDVVRMRELVTAMPAELCEDDPLVVGARTQRLRARLLAGGGGT